MTNIDKSHLSKVVESSGCILDKRLGSGGKGMGQGNRDKGQRDKKRNGERKKGTGRQKVMGKWKKVKRPKNNIKG